MIDAPMTRSLFLAAWLGVLPPAVGLSADPTPEKKQAKPFLIDTEERLQSEEFGVVMQCPAHAHGEPNEAYEKLKGILGTRPADRISAIWICQVNLLETLKKFGPLVDRIVVNPFRVPSSEGPNAGDLIWSNLDHPCVNMLRQIRAEAPGKELIANLYVGGLPAFFPRRGTCFEEVQWMVYAVVGANFQGLIWRGRLDRLPFKNRLRRLETGLKQYADELGAARPAGWAKAPDDQPMSALGADRTLFVVLLHPQFMTPYVRNQQIRLPLNPSVRRGQIELSPPSGLTVLGGSTLSGQALRLNPSGKRIHVKYHFTGGGEILIFRLSGSSSSQPAPSSEARARIEEHQP